MLTSIQPTFTYILKTIVMYLVSIPVPHTNNLQEKNLKIKNLSVPLLSDTAM